MSIQELFASLRVIDKIKNTDKFKDYMILLLIMHMFNTRIELVYKK